MNRLLPITAVLLLAGCGSIVHGTRQSVGINSSPSSARVTVDGQPMGQTPMVAKLSRKDNHVVSLALDGYAPAEMTLTRKVSGWVWGNIVFGGLIGLAVDAITGGMYKLTPEQLQATLATRSASIAPTRDGVYIVMVQAPEPGWVKIGQLTRLTPTTVGE